MLAIALTWVTALVTAPAAASYVKPYGPLVSAVIYTSGSLVCHQRPERSFHVGDVQLPVCARCFGLYLGGLLGVMAWAGIAGVRSRASLRAQRIVASSRLRFALAIVALPTVLSIVSAALGWWDLANIGRAVVALPLGAAIAAVVTAVAAGDLR